MELSIVKKSSVNEHVLINKNTYRYYMENQNTTIDLLNAKKYKGYTIAQEDKKKMSNPSEWKILKVKTSCEVIDICK